jgi:predicted nucleic acid-binding protein
LRICIDTTIFIDILKDEYRSFQEKFYRALEENQILVAPAVVYGELMPQFGADEKKISEFFYDHKIAIEPLDTASAAAAARSWMKYLRRREKLKCVHCGRHLPQRAHLLSDFLIGGYALARCDEILTRDRGIYVRYFPGLVGYADCLG